MGVYKRGNSWYIHYFVNGRRFRQKAGTKKRDAENALAVVKADIIRRKFSIPKQETVTFRDYANRYFETCSKNKRSCKRDEITLRAHLLPFFGEETLNAINKNRVEDYQTQRRKDGMKPATIVRELALLSHLYSRAIEEELVQVNPVKQVKLAKPDNIIAEFPSEEEIGKIREGCTEDFRPVFLAAINSGMRRGELLSLQWKNVDLEQKVIRVTQTKSGKDRLIPINDRLMEVLVPLRAEAKSEYVFTSKKTGGPFKDFEYIWKGALRRAGVKRYRFHQLRHEFASMLDKKRAGLVTIQELLGHSDIRMTQRYLHSAAEFKREAVALLNDRFEANDSLKGAAVGSHSVA